jgi:hypothetical protein
VNSRGCRQAHHLFADIAAGQHVDERRRSRLQAFGNRLAEFEAPGAVLVHQLVERLVAPCEMTADAETLQFDAFVEEDAGVA